MIILKLPKSCYATLFGFCLLGLGLYHLDPILLVHHRTGEGWVSNVYTDPHQLPGGRNQNSYYPDLYYTYTDAKGERYPRKSPVMLGYEEPGDTFPVLYHPAHPSRHLPLTGFGLLPPLLLLTTGILFSIIGCRKCFTDFRREYTLKKRKKEEKQADSLTPLLRRTALNVTRKARKVHKLKELGWLELSSTIQPNQRSLYFVFESDAALEQAAAQGITEKIHSLAQARLEQDGYPPEWLAEVAVLFTSLESMKRDFGDSIASRVTMIKD